MKSCIIVCVLALLSGCAQPEYNPSSIKSESVALTDIIQCERDRLFNVRFAGEEVEFEPWRHGRFFCGVLRRKPGELYDINRWRFRQSAPLWIFLNFSPFTFPFRRPSLYAQSAPAQVETARKRLCANSIT